jgi:O-antigen/teichoic acid export membrane protein
MSMTRRFAWNTAVSYASLGGIVVIGFLFTPFLIRELGKERYGLWVLCISVGHYTRLVDVGFLSAIRRFLSKAWAKGDAGEINDVLAASLRIYVPLGVAALLLSLSAIVWLPQLVDIPQGMRGEFAVLMACVGMDIFLNFARGSFSGILFGANRLDLDKLVLLVQRGLLAGIGVTLILLWRKALYGPSAGLLAAAVISSAVLLLLSRRVFPDMRVARAGRRSEFAGPMARFAMHGGAMAVGMVIFHQTPKLLAGTFLGLKLVAALGVLLLISNQIRQFIHAAALPMFPMASRYDADDDRRRMKQLYIRGSRLALILALSATVPLVVFGKTFIGLWVGEDLAWTWVLLGVLLGGEVFDYAQLPAVHMLTAARSIRGIAVVRLLQALLLVGGLLAVLSLTSWGLAGVVGVQAGLSMVLSGLVICYIACRQLKLSMASCWLRSHVGPLAAAALGAAACWGIRTVWTPANLPLAVVQVLAGAALCGLIALVVAMDKEDRARIRSVLKRSPPPPAVDEQ